MICPKCMRDKFVNPNGEHYVCIEESLPAYETGCGTQFIFVQDEKIMFPYNVIFNERGNPEFFRKPYLELTPLGMSENE